MRDYLNVPGVHCIDSDIIEFKEKYYSLTDVQDYLSWHFEKSVPTPFTKETFKAWIKENAVLMYDALSIIDEVSYPKNKKGEIKMTIEEKLHELTDDELFQLLNEYLSLNKYEAVYHNSEQFLLSLFDNDYQKMKNSLRKDFDFNAKYFSTDGYGFVYSFDNLWDKVQESELIDYLDNNYSAKFNYLTCDEEEGSPTDESDDSYIAEGEVNVPIVNDNRPPRVNDKKLSLSQRIDIKKLTANVLGLKYSSISNMLKEIKDNWPSSYDDNTMEAAVPWLKTFINLKSDLEKDFDKANYVGSMRQFKKERAEKFLSVNKIPLKGKFETLVKNYSGTNDYPWKDFIQKVKALKNDEENVKKSFSVNTDKDEATLEKEIENHIANVFHSTAWRYEEDDDIVDLLEEVIKLYKDQSLTAKDAQALIKQLHKGHDIEGIKYSIDQAKVNLSHGRTSDDEQDLDKEIAQIIYSILDINEKDWASVLMSSAPGCGFSQEFINQIYNYINLVKKGDRTKEQFIKAMRNLKSRIEYRSKGKSNAYANLKEVENFFNSICSNPSDADKLLDDYEEIYNDARGLKNVYDKLTAIGYNLKDIGKIIQEKPEIKKAMFIAIGKNSPKANDEFINFLKQNNLVENKTAVSTTKQSSSNKPKAKK